MFSGLAAEIAEVIGEPRTRVLLHKRGGTEIKIPSRPGHSLLAGIIGQEACAAMIDHFGPGTMRLPLGPIRGQAARRSRGIALLREGKTNREVALICDVDVRTVERWRQDTRSAAQSRAQLSLPFDPSETG